MGTWVARNNGLTGTLLNVNYIVIVPGTRHQPSTGHVVFIATDGGVLKSTNGGRSWSQFTLPDPNNAQFGDSPAATVDELTFHWIAFSPLNLNIFHVLAAKDSVSRLWLYKSSDSGTSWISRGVIAE